MNFEDDIPVPDKRLSITHLTHSLPLISHPKEVAKQTLKTRISKKGITLTLLPTRLLNLRRGPIPNQAVSRLKLLHHLVALVNEREAGALPATVLGAEAKDGDLVLVGFVEFGELLPQLIFGDVGTVGMEDIPAFRGRMRLC